MNAKLKDVHGSMAILQEEVKHWHVKHDELKVESQRVANMNRMSFSQVLNSSSFLNEKVIGEGQQEEIEKLQGENEEIKKRFEVQRL